MRSGELVADELVGRPSRRIAVSTDTGIACIGVEPRASDLLFWIYNCETPNDTGDRDPPIYWVSQVPVANVTVDRDCGKPSSGSDLRLRWKDRASFPNASLLAFTGMSAKLWRFPGGLDGQRDED